MGKYLVRSRTERSGRADASIAGAVMRPTHRAARRAAGADAAAAPARRGGGQGEGAPRRVTAADLIERRMLRLASLPRERASVAKAAARGPVRGRRHGAGDG